MTSARPSRRVVLLAVAIVAGLAVAPPAAQEKKPLPSGLTEHVKVELVQLNFIATDRKGTPVTDLGVDEIELSEGGVPQKVAFLQKYYAPRAAGAAPAPGGAGSEPAPGKSVSPLAGLVPAVTPRRWIVLLVDNFATRSLTAVQSVEAARQFVEKDLAPGDQVALMVFGGKINVVQGFTTDRERLSHAAAVALSAVDHAVEDRFASLESLIDDMDRCRSQSNPVACAEKYAGAYQDERFREADALMIALTTIVRSLGAIPDIKTVVLFSEGFSRDPLGDAQDAASVSLGGRAPRLMVPGDARQDLDAAYERLAEAAASARVSIFTVNPGGAARNRLVSAARGGIVDEASGAMQIDPFRRSEQNYQAGLAEVARRTGGTATQGSDILGDLRGAVDLSAGLYSVGYYPSRDVPLSRLRDVRVRILRKGVKVEGRREFPHPAAVPPLTGELKLTPDACSERGRRAVTLRFRLDRSKLLFEDLEKSRSANFSLFVRFLYDGASEPAFQDYRFLNITATPQELAAGTMPDPVLEETLTVPCRRLTVAITASDAGSGARGEFTAVLEP